MGLLARSYDLGFLMARQSHGSQISHVEAQGSTGECPDKKGGGCIAFSDPALKSMQSLLLHFVVVVVVVINKPQAHWASRGGEKAPPLSQEEVKYAGIWKTCT